MTNPILRSDSYKTSHYLQYPPGTEYVSSYIEARGGANKVLYFGLQPFLQQLENTRITRQDVVGAAVRLKRHGVPFNHEGWDHIVDNHGGKLPVRIEALDEGMIVPTGTPLVQIVNTDPKVPWLTSYLETSLLRAIWYPTTVATISYMAKQTIWDFLVKTSDDPVGQLPFKLHDFGARGVSSGESAAIGGVAHLVNFMGTDTMEALEAADVMYGECNAGFSIPASEHSTITSWGREGEREAYGNMIARFGGGGKVFACVSDSYDIYNACEKLWGGALIDQVRSNGGTLVVRPDSGDPASVILKVLTILGEKFGVTLNKKGYAVLPDCIRVIQGDGVDLGSIRQILVQMQMNGWSADNIAFGMGGGLLQKCDRDTFKFAMKASAICINGEWRDVYKDPVTDPGKISKRGRLAVVESSGIGGFGIETVRAEQIYNGRKNLMSKYYDDYHMHLETTLAAVRQRAGAEFSLTP